VPKIIDKIGKTEDYALILIVILGLAFGLSFADKELGSRIPLCPVTSFGVHSPISKKCKIRHYQ
jgi:hypothetical protein